MNFRASKIKLFVIPAFVVALGMANVALAQDCYVATNGVDIINGEQGSSASLPWRTISFAVANATPGVAIHVASGVYNESVTVNKHLTILGDDTSAVIHPPTGNGMNITGSPVTIQNIQIRGGGSSGIVSINDSNVTLINVYCLRNAQSGVQFTNLKGVTVSGGSYSYNGRHGFNTTNGSNYTVANVRADSNGWKLTGSGILLVGITGTSQVTSPTARFNYYNGLVAGDGTTGLTIDGGIYHRNGYSRGYQGSGILIYAEVASDSNIVIQGNVIADSNYTAGIWLSSQQKTFFNKNILIGQSGTTTLSYNGGVGVFVYGNNSSVTVTGTFTRGTQSAAGVFVTGYSNNPPVVLPSNIAINNCTFTAGYDSAHPAISLDDTFGDVCTIPVLANGNTFHGLSTPDSLEWVIHDSLDNPSLGRLRHTNDNVLPVELNSFSAGALGHDVTLVWSTATEVNNYGFEIQRANGRQTSVAVPSIENRQSNSTPWSSPGFVHGFGSSFTPHSYSFTDRSVPDGQYLYRLKQIDVDGTYSFSGQVEVAVGSFSDRAFLGQNYPNPFNPVTTIEFAVPVSGKVSVQVFNILGQLVTTLFQGEAQAGTRYQVQFDATHFTTGLYFYRLATGQSTIVRKMLVVK